MLYCNKNARWLFFTMTTLILVLCNIVPGFKMKASIKGILKNVGKKMILKDLWEKKYIYISNTM